MKWIGSSKGKLGQGEINGELDYIEEIAVITEVINSNTKATYDIEKYTKYHNGQLGKNTMIGAWTFTLGGAKRIINKDTGKKDKDWVWEIIK